MSAMSVARCKALCVVVSRLALGGPVRTMATKYSTEERGAPYSADYRLYFRDELGLISPMHDIPLWADEEAGVANMVVEIPRWTNAKMEISLSEPLNPVKQDVKKGAPRFVANVFPHRGYIWNYGALPQTWEDPAHVDELTQCRGDNDPIDVLEVGDRVARRGEVLQVKIFGALAFIDDGETDWKLLAVDAASPLAARLGSPEDLERERPGLLRASREWLRLYKVPGGAAPAPAPGPALSRAAALSVVRQTHAAWRSLLCAPASPLARACTVCAEPGAGRLSRERAAELLQAAPARAEPLPVPEEVDRWHFLADL